MKNALLLCILLLSLCLLCGCTHWMDGSYASVTPNHSSQDSNTEDVIHVSSYESIRSALITLIESGEQEAILYVSGLSDVMMEYHTLTCQARKLRRKARWRSPRKAKDTYIFPWSSSFNCASPR